MVDMYDKFDEKLENYMFQLEFSLSYENCSGRPIFIFLKKIGFVP